MNEVEQHNSVKTTFYFTFILLVDGVKTILYSLSFWQEDISVVFLCLSTTSLLVFEVSCLPEYKGLAR
jgi:hypothetical protein